MPTSLSDIWDSPAPRHRANRRDEAGTFNFLQCSPLIGSDHLRQCQARVGGSILEDAHLQPLTSVSGSLHELQGTSFTFEEGSFLVGQRRPLCVLGLFCAVPESFLKDPQVTAGPGGRLSPFTQTGGDVWVTSENSIFTRTTSGCKSGLSSPPAISLLFLANWQKINERGTD